MNSEKQEFPVTLPNAPEITHEHVDGLRGNDKQFIRVVRFSFGGTPTDMEEIEVIVGSTMFDDELLEHDTNQYTGIKQKDGSVMVRIPIYDPEVTHIEIKPADTKRFMKKLWQIPRLPPNTAVDTPQPEGLTGEPTSDGDVFSNGNVNMAKQPMDRPLPTEVPPLRHLDPQKDIPTDLLPRKQKPEATMKGAGGAPMPPPTTKAPVTDEDEIGGITATEATKEKPARAEAEIAQIKAQVQANKAASDLAEANRLQAALDEAEAQRLKDERLKVTEEKQRIEAELHKKWEKESAEAARKQEEALPPQEVAHLMAEGAEEVRIATENKRLEDEALTKQALAELMEEETVSAQTAAFVAEAVAPTQAPVPPPVPEEKEADLPQPPKPQPAPKLFNVPTTAAPKSPLNKGTSGTDGPKKDEKKNEGSPWPVLGAIAAVLVLLLVGIGLFVNHFRQPATQVAVVTPVVQPVVTPVVTPVVPVVTPPVAPVPTPVVAPVAPVIASTPEVIEGCTYALYGKEQRGRRLTSGGVFFSCPSETENTVIAKVNADGKPLCEGMRIVKIVVSQN